MAIFQQCQSLNFICSENIIESVGATIVMVLMLIGLKVIVHDVNQVLVKIDKAIYTLSTVQVFLVVCYSTFIGTDFAFSTIKCFNILTGSLICNILSTIVFDESNYETIWLILKAVQGLTLLEWFWTAVVHKSIQDFNCFQKDYLILSTTLILVALLAFYFGTKALFIISQFKKEKIQQLNQGLDDEGNLIIINDMKNREIQIKILIISLATVSIIQFSWDYISYQGTVFPKDCERYFTPHSIIGVIGFTALKFIVFMGFPLALYTVFYRRNLAQFNEARTVNSEDNLQILIRQD